MAVIGETGTGKTTLVAYLLGARANSIALRTKADTTKLPGRLIRHTADVERYPREDHFLLEPRFEDQRDEAAAMFRYVWAHSTPKAGGWCCYVDELYYLDEMLGLAPFVDRNLTQGRSKLITQVCGMQRPVGQTRFAISESRHVLTFALDGRDAKTFCEATSAALLKPVTSLGRYEILWYYRPERSAKIVRLANNGAGPLELVTSV